MNRRHFVKTTLAVAALPSLVAAHGAKSRKHILLRSSWQTVNIGDIAHTPGMLALLEKHLPEYEVTLWPSSVDNGVEEMVNKRFPKVKILGKEVGLKDEVFKTYDFLLHGSGRGTGDTDHFKPGATGLTTTTYSGLLFTWKCLSTFRVISGWNHGKISEN